MDYSFCFSGLILIILGFNMFLSARSARKRDQIRESWPTSKGTIFSIEAVSQKPLSAKGKAEQPLYDINASYQFRAGGQMHYGSFLTYPRHFFLQKEVERIQEQYKKGMNVDVHYNLENPQECYLKYERSEKHYRTSILMMVLGAILFILDFLL
jgi:hypothetical protein